MGTRGTVTVSKVHHTLFWHSDNVTDTTIHLTEKKIDECYQEASSVMQVHARKYRNVIAVQNLHLPVFDLICEDSCQSSDIDPNRRDMGRIR